MVVEESILDKVANFVLKYSMYSDIDKIREYMELHIKYRTCFVTTDSEGEITSVCRWNFENNGRTAHILDLYVREDLRNANFIKEQLIKNLTMYPMVRFLKWSRTKYPNRPEHIYSVRQLLRR